MSIEAENWWRALEKFEAGRQRFSGSESAVMGYLAQMTNRSKHYAWPSFRRMSREVGIETRSLQRVVVGLRERDIVRVQKAFNGDSGRDLSSNYYLPYARGSNPWRWWDARLIGSEGDAELVPVEVQSGLWVLRPAAETRAS